MKHGEFFIYFAEVKISGDMTWKSQVKKVKVVGFSGDVRLENPSEVRELGIWKIEIQ